MTPKRKPAGAVAIVRGQDRATDLRRSEGLSTNPPDQANDSRRARGNDEHTSSNKDVPWMDTSRTRNARRRACRDPRRRWVLAIARAAARSESDRQTIHSFWFLQLSISANDSIFALIFSRFSRCEFRHATSRELFDFHQMRTPLSGSRSLQTTRALLTALNTQLHRCDTNLIVHCTLASQPPHPPRTPHNGDPQPPPKTCKPTNAHDAKPCF